MRKIFCLPVFILLFIAHSQGQQVLPLYTDSIPNSIGMVAPNDVPSITAYIPPTAMATGTAIIIFPGGAYTFLATNTEGTPIAEAFVQKGIAAFVVKYRLPKETTMRDKSFAPLMDAQQTMLLVKNRSKEWNIDTNKIGVIGYSAGGHLAAMLGTHYNTSYVPNPQHTGLRPAFMILVYPVISMEAGLTHRGSRVKLLGMEPTAEQVHYFSTEANVSSQMPPTYITHAGDDRVVTVENSVVFYQALKQKNVNAELHIFPRGDHGFTQRLPVEEWLDPMLRFLKRGGWY